MLPSPIKIPSGSAVKLKNSDEEVEKFTSPEKLPKKRR
jgi:hypothetical protein